MHHAEIYRGWLVHNGKTVKLDGVSHTLRCTTHFARYPIKVEVISVHAEPDKNSAHYKEIKRQLGDDWSVDVLDSDIELQAEILQQLAA